MKFKNIKCPICDNKKYRNLFYAKDNRLYTTNQKFNLVTCNNCGLVYINPQPDSQELSKFYPPNYYSPYSPLVYHSKLDFLFYLIANKQDQLLLKQIDRLSKGSKLLEIGCGTGALLSKFRKEGYDIFGIDTNPNILKIISRDIQNKIKIGDLLNCSFQKAYFDVIVMKQVLEHIPDPNAMLSEAYRILKPSGLLYIEVPNFHCLETKLFKRYCYNLEIPRHLYQYTIESLINTGRRNGFVPAAYLRNFILDFFAEPLTVVKSFQYFLNDKKFLNVAFTKVIILTSSIPILILTFLLSLSRVKYEKHIRIIFQKAKVENTARDRNK